MPYLDGLPPATSVSVTDLIALDQGGTPNIPGTATTRKATVAQFLGGGTTPFLPIIGGTLTGPLIVNSTLNVSGAATLSGNVAIGGTLGVTGLLTASGNILTPFVGSPAATLTLQNSGNPTVVHGHMEIDSPNPYNITGNNGGSASNPWFTSFIDVVNAGGAGSPLVGGSVVNGFTVNDRIFTNSGITGVLVQHNIAPNGTSTSGPRNALSVNLIMVGSSAGGTITGTATSSAAVFNAWSHSNLGGTSTNYLGAVNGANPVAKLLTGATFNGGATGVEIDTSAQTGTNYGDIKQQLNVILADHATPGYLNENLSILIGAQAGALNDIMYGLRFIDQDSTTPFGTKAKLIYAGLDHDGAVSTVASNLDFGNTTVGAFHMRGPYSVEVPLQATGITGATRLTSDGLAASSFIYEATTMARGTGYTSFPTVTVTGGAGTTVRAMLGTGAVISKPGVFAAGTGVPPEATAAVTGGGGAGATVALTMTGNTMNFAINSAVDFDARVVMRSTTGEAICWSCEFGARMGATASTTAIIGAPTWTQVWATAGAAAAIGISNPTADTTLGAINITVTPTSLTWSGGGKVKMTKTSRV